MASSAAQSAETTEKVIKVQILHYRNPSMTEEEYYDHWSKTHAALAAPWLARNGVLKYALFHTPQKDRDNLAPMAKSAGWKIHNHDGSVELWVRSLDDLARATQDPDYIANIHPDESHFLDKSRTEVIIGWEEVRVLDGKVV
ncbi:EthD domain-containing protein [Macrophomina phaseolina]|uniref:EthD domain-containing protein n=1 Tax=Macrophomina phaseolina TaxID=35725 RepID=A0ABQ8GIJ3_9PEZI|nr:EthD domain-containing protein [Macrophomina phaseolina]